MKKNILYLLLGDFGSHEFLPGSEFVLLLRTEGNHELDCTLYFGAIRG